MIVPTDQATGTASAAPTGDHDDDVSITSGDVNTCPGDGSFTIAANAAPDLNGCYQDTGSTDAVSYTVSGTLTTSEIVVLSVEFEDTGDVSRLEIMVIFCVIFKLILLSVSGFMWVVLLVAGILRWGLAQSLSGS